MSDRSKVALRHTFGAYRARSAARCCVLRAYLDDATHLVASGASRYLDSCRRLHQARQSPALSIDGGPLVMPDAAATLIVQRHSVAEAGDHVIALFQVVDHHRDDTAIPLVFHGGRFGTLAASGDAPFIHEGGM